MIDWQTARRMSIDEYEEALDKLDMNVSQAGRFLGVSPRTAARYAHGETEIPEGFVLLLRLMIAFNVTPVVPKWKKL